MTDRTDRQRATVATMIDIAEGMAAQTMRIARRDVTELGTVSLSAEEGARLDEALLHIEQAAGDLRRLRECDTSGDSPGARLSTGDIDEGEPGN